MLGSRPTGLRKGSVCEKKRAADLNGAFKIRADALCEALAINDNRITEIHLYKQRDPTHPRIEVTLIPAPRRS